MGALGPLMTRTAAQVADGLLVMPFHSHKHIRTNTLPAVEEGLRERETPGELKVYPQAILAMGRTPEEQERADLAWGLVLDSLVFAAEAEIRWLDHCEARLRRAAREGSAAGGSR